MNVTGNFRRSNCKRHLEITLGKMLQPSAASGLDEPIAYIRAANVHWGRVDWNDLKEMWFSPYDRKKYSLENGDLVVLEGGDVGRCAILDGSPERLGFQNSIHRVRVRTGTYIRFVYYWMAHLKACGYLDLVCSKATLAHFTREKFAEAPFPVVDLETQRQIADFLDRETARIDLLIEKKQRLVALLGERQEAKIQSAVSGEDALERLPCDNQFFASVPTGWRVQSLKSVFNVVSGYAFKSEFFRKGATDLPVLVTPGSFNPHGGLYPIRDNDVGYFGEFETRYLLEEGDMVVAMTDLSYRKLILGRCEFVDRGGMLLNQRIAKIVNLHPAVKPEFLRYAMNARSSREQVSLSAVGATVFHSSADKIRSTHILVPPPEVQERIVADLDHSLRSTTNLIQKGAASIDRLKEYRSALITAAVTGQIDVGAYGKHGAVDGQLDALQAQSEA